ncbi:MAG: DNA topoisomerase, partial [Planctomycetes bacterium]|nr:DNA topoisomerase [Planctomycetota bacterium]
LASTKAGRMYVRLNENDRVVNVFIVNKEKSLMLASKSGHIIHFSIDEVNILSGVGKGVIGIKLDEEDCCLGGVVISGKDDFLTVETTNGKTMEFRPGKYEMVTRGGKGFEAVKRSEFAKIIPPAIKLVNWDEIVDSETQKPSSPKGLFD